MLLEESKKLEQLIEGILKAAHKTEPHFQKVNPNELLDELKALTQEKARLSNVKIRKEKHLASEPIFVDKESVIAALKEIVMNAVEASPKDGEVLMKIGQEDEWVVISVTDQGQGMDEKTLSRIYEPLFSTKKLSAGLGLSFAKELIEAQNGYIRCESSPGKGSTFNVYFSAFKESNKARVHSRRRK
jgi:signal transduction histidine kinase